MKLARIELLIIFLFASTCTFSQDSVKVVQSFFSHVDFSCQHPYIYNNETNGVVVFKNKRFHLNLEIDTNSNVSSLDDGYIYYYNIDYFVVIDTILFKDDSCLFTFHTTARFVSDSNRNQSYFKCYAILFKEENWRVIDYHIEPLDCCHWKNESY